MNFELTQGLAERVLQSVLSAVEQPGIICGPGGVILAAADRSRVGTVHQGSLRILRGECDEIALTEEDAARIGGVRPGYNCVILWDDRRVGSIGIQGDPARVKGAARVAARVVQLEFENLVQKERIRLDVLERVESVMAAAEQILSGTDDHRKLADQLQAATAELQRKGASTAGALQLIQDLAQRANLLGLNAAVEAAHVAEAGRVAREQADAIRAVTEEIVRIEEAVANLAASTGGDGHGRAPSA